MSTPDIATWTWGSGEATLVFLHALLPTATGRSVGPVATRLTERLPVRVVGVDAPGFGGSAPLEDVEYEPDRLAARLGNVAGDAAAGPFVVAGHSWGAALAVRIAAARTDVHGLVLLDGGHFDHADLPDADPGQTVDETQAEMAVLGWDASGADPRAAAAAMTALMHSRSSPSYPRIHDRGVPVLLLTATEPEQRRLDNVTRTAGLTAALPRARAVALPGAGHDLLTDVPDLVADHVAHWWRTELTDR